MELLSGTVSEIVMLVLLQYHLVDSLTDGTSNAQMYLITVIQTLNSLHI